MEVQPYLFFDGRCEEAIGFYRQKLGAEVVMLMRYKETPKDSGTCAPGTEEKIMHCTLKIGDTTLMASDGHCENKTTFKGFALSIAPPSIPEAQRLFAALSEGGQVQMPLAKTFWSPSFGMLTDKFGVFWMINAAH
jgi:PhnB protein